VGILAHHPTVVLKEKKKRGGEILRLQGSENAKFMVAATTLIFILLFIPFSNLPNE